MSETPAEKPETPTGSADGARDEVVTALELLQAWLHEALPQFLVALKGIATFPERTRNSLETMARAGWFLVGTMPPTCAFEVANAILDGKDEDADALMCGYCEASFDEILAEIEPRFPQRLQIIRKALAAHSRQDYELSVPVLLAQADGMAAEILGAGLYSKTRPTRRAEPVPALRPAIEARLESLDWATKWVYGAAFDPLLRLLPLAVRSSADVRGTMLNRHAVLHGETCDYATRKSSCQAISLVSYVNLVVRLIGDATANTV